MFFVTISDPLGSKDLDFSAYTMEHIKEIYVSHQNFKIPFILGSNVLND